MKPFTFLLLASSLFSASLFSAPVAQASGLRNTKTVLNEVLVRGGGPGGKVSLRDEGLETLCSQGFTEAVYLYSENANNRTLRCGSNSVRYESISFTKGERRILEKVYSAITSGSGPIFVHCWNGKHAAGQIAAVALRQYCGYSADKAVKYWQDNVPASDRNAYPKVLRNIQNFVPHSDLKISRADQERVCP